MAGVLYGKIDGRIYRICGGTPASIKFWEMENRIKQDKKTPGVCIEVRTRDMYFDLIRLMNDKIITFDDLEEERE
ncbi:hypothetical protein [Eubacterium aggregans]|uniref:hypothetical protein n=1 Tax=Eubacterium aggregans TaxID=81409 RepID=UPI003F41A544